VSTFEIVLSVGHLAGNRVFRKIDNNNFCRMRKVKPMRQRIDRENIPAAFTADWYLAQKFVRTFIRGRRVLQRKGTRHHQQRIETHYTPLSRYFALSAFACFAAQLKTDQISPAR
jgi:hypothetical protein